MYYVVVYSLSDWFTLSSVLLKKFIVFLLLFFVNYSHSGIVTSVLLAGGLISVSRLFLMARRMMYDIGNSSLLAWARIVSSKFVSNLSVTTVVFVMFCDIVRIPLYVDKCKLL